MLVYKAVVATKKIIVILLMVVLASSVAAGASSIFSGPRSSTVTEQDINVELNRIVDFCIESLPAGVPECDQQLREVVDNSCRTTNDGLDVCKSNKVDQYFRSRQTE
jgi:hypothetical protein